MIFRKLRLTLHGYYNKKNLFMFYNTNEEFCFDFKNFKEIITSISKKIDLCENPSYRKKILVIEKKFIIWKLFFIYNILFYFIFFDKKKMQICKKDIWLYIWFVKMKFLSTSSSSIYYIHFIKIYYIQIFKELRFFLQKNKIISSEINLMPLNLFIFQIFHQTKIQKKKKIFLKMNFSLIFHQTKIHLKKDFFIKKVLSEKLQKKKNCFDFLYIDFISLKILNFKLRNLFLNSKKKTVLYFFLFYEFKKIYYFLKLSKKSIFNSLDKFYDSYLGSFLQTIYINFRPSIPKQSTNFMKKKQHFWCYTQGFYEQNIHFEKKKKLYFVHTKFNFLMYNFFFNKTFF
nr:hypothetical protein CparaKRNrm2_p014 [Cryptomonas paramecium]